MSSTHVFNPANKWFFLFTWILANIVSLPVLIVGPIGISLVLMFILGRAFDGNIQEDKLIYLITFPVLIFGAVSGAWMGVMQWFVLRQQHLAQSSIWILASSVGAAVGTLIYWLTIFFIWTPGVSPILVGLWLPLGFGIVFGGFIGLSQWFVLRRWVHQASWWILTVIVSANLGIGFIAISFIGQIGIEFVRGSFVEQISNPPAIGIFLMISFLLAGVIIGIITGGVLFWLLRSQRR